MLEIKTTESGTNQEKVVCKFVNCNSVYLRANAGKVLSKIKLPISWPYEQDKQVEEADEELKYIEVKDYMTFENMGLSKTIEEENLKLLACADCDNGPVGFCLWPNGPAYLLGSHVNFK